MEMFFQQEILNSHAKENMEILENLCKDMILKPLMCKWNFGMVGLIDGIKKLFVEILRSL